MKDQPINLSIQIYKGQSVVYFSIFAMCEKRLQHLFPPFSFSHSSQISMHPPGNVHLSESRLAYRKRKNHLLRQLFTKMFQYSSTDCHESKMLQDCHKNDRDSVKITLLITFTDHRSGKDKDKLRYFGTKMLLRSWRSLLYRTSLIL